MCTVLRWELKPVNTPGSLDLQVNTIQYTLISVCVDMGRTILILGIHVGGQNPLNLIWTPDYTCIPRIQVNPLKEFTYIRYASPK